MDFAVNFSYTWIFFILLAIKIYLNFLVYKELHPQKRFLFKINSDRNPFATDEEKADDLESSFNFMYLVFILFWINYPKSLSGKVRAISVLLISILHVILLANLNQTLH